MCVCVCFGDPCAQNFELRDYFERLLCWLDHWLSCMLDCIHVCVFLLSKNCFEKLARHLLDTLLSVELLKPFSYRNPDSSSIPSGSIENALASSIASWHLVDRLSFCSWIWFLVARYFLNTLAFDDHFLDTYLDSFLDTSRHLHLLSFIEGLYILSLRSVSHFFNLSRSVCTCSSPKHSLSHSKPLPLWFFMLFQDSSSLGKFPISYSSCISCFET